MRNITSAREYIVSVQPEARSRVGSYRHWKEVRYRGKKYPSPVDTRNVYNTFPLLADSGDRGEAVCVTVRAIVFPHIRIGLQKLIDSENRDVSRTSPYSQESLRRHGGNVCGWKEGSQCRVVFVRIEPFLTGALGSLGTFLGASWLLFGTYIQ